MLPSAHIYPAAFHERSVAAGPNSMRLAELRVSFACFHSLSSVCKDML